MDSYGGEVGGNPLLHNSYIYALNNPVKYRDTEGNFAIAAALAIGGVIVTGLLATGYKPLVTITQAVGGGVANVLDTIAPKLNFDPNYKEKEEAKEKAQENVKPVIPYAPKEEELKPCTTAQIFKNDVVRGYRMTIEESQHHVSFGYDVMCDTQQDARRVASKWPGFYHDDPHQKIPGYYPHYHPWDGRNHPHIWYYLNT